MDTTFMTLMIFLVLRTDFVLYSIDIDDSD